MPTLYVIPGTCESFTLHGKREFVDVIKVRMLRWGDNPGSSRWTQLERGRVRGDMTMKADVRGRTQLEASHEPRNVGSL